MTPQTRVRAEQPGAVHTPAPHSAGKADLLTQTEQNKDLEERRRKIPRKRLCQGDLAMSQLSCCPGHRENLFRGRCPDGRVLERRAEGLGRAPVGLRWVFRTCPDAP